MLYVGGKNEILRIIFKIIFKKKKKGKESYFLNKIINIYFFRYLNKTFKFKNINY